MDIAKLLKYVKNGEEENLKSGLADNPKVKTPKNMKTLAAAAIEADNVDIVVILLNNGVNANASLDIAVNCGSEETIKLLVKRGANENDGLYFAIKANKPNVISLLLGLGADINTDKRQGSTPLHTAITQKCDVNMVRFLIENGANCSARTKNNKTALDLVQSLLIGKNDTATQENFLRIEDLLKSNTPSDNEFECLQGLPDGLSGYSYQIKLFTLYAVVNTKQAILRGCKYELGTEVTAALPFDDIFLRETQNGKTTYCRFVQVKQTKKPYLNKIQQSNFFTMLKCEKNIKEYVKGHDTIVKMFVKYNEIMDSNLVDGITGDFIYCTNTNFLDTLSSCFSREEIVKDDRFYGVGQEKWLINGECYLLIELKFVLLNFIESSSAVRVIDEELRKELMEQITILDNFKLDYIENKSLESLALWPVYKIVNEGLNAINTYLEFLDNSKLQIKSASDAECVKISFPEECELPHDTGDLNLFKNSAIEKINEAYKRMKTDKDLFSHFKNWDDNTINTKINNFVKHFCIYTECPSSDELDEIITKEISQEFKYHNSVFLSIYCVQYLTKWVSSFKNKRGKLFTSENGKGLFYALRGLIFKGLSEPYIEELQAHNIHFNNDNKQILDFITQNNNKNVLHVATDHSHLHAIKALRTLKKIEGQDTNSKYTNNILFTSSELLFKSENMLKNMIHAFSSDIHYNLIIIDVPNDSKKHDSMVKLVNELNNIFKKNINKKIIVIAKSDNTLASQLKFITKKHATVTESVEFKDLTKESQEHILEKSVIFQMVQSSMDKGIKLKDLFDVQSVCEVMDEFMLSTIIMKQEGFKIGDAKAFHSGEYIPEFYQPRTVHHQVIDINTLENINEHLTFVTGISKEELLKKIHIGEESIHLWEDNKTFQKGIILIPDRDIHRIKKTSEEIFTLLSQECVNINWFEYRAEHFFWKGLKTAAQQTDSFNIKLSEMNEYILEDGSISPETLDQKIVILANNPGEGKSTMLTDLARSLKSKSPNLWIIRIDLKDYVGDKFSLSLININFLDEDISKAIDTIARMVVQGDLNNHDIKLERKLLEAALKGCMKTNVILLFDGFDEISPDYKEKACILLKALKGSNVRQMWVTTRVQLKDYLVQQLQTSACMLTPFTKTQQISFLNKFWKWLLKYYYDQEDMITEEDAIFYIVEHLKMCLEHYSKIGKSTITFKNLMNNIIDTYIPSSNLSDLQKTIDNELDLSPYAEISLEMWKVSIRDDSNFTKVPLNLKMLGESIFKTKWQISYVENMSLFTLYKQFIDYKLINIYQQNKSTTQRGNQADKDLVDVAAAIFRKMHHELAVKILFQPSIGLPDLNVCNEFPNVYEKLTRIGLVRAHGDYVQFVHRSYAEYFFVEYLFIHLKDSNVQSEFLMSILVNDNYHLMRAFLDAFLAQADQNNDNWKWQPVIYSEKHFLIPSVIEEMTTHHNSRGEGALHVASLNSHLKICWIILINAQGYNDNRVLKQLITQCDNEGRPALHLAARNGNIEACRIILETVKEDPKVFRDVIMTCDAEEQTALHIASSIGSVEICDLIMDNVKENPDLFKDLILNCDTEGQTVLHTAAEKGNKLVCYRIMETVKEHANDIFKKLLMKGDLEGITALHVAVKHDNVEACDIIIDFVKHHSNILKRLMKKCDDEGQTILHVAASENNRAVFELIISKMKEHYKIMKYLIRKRDVMGQTILHSAAWRGHVEICKIIINAVKMYPKIFKDFIMTCDEEGQNAMESALWTREKEIYYVIMEAILEQSDVFEEVMMKTHENAQTVLHIAILKGRIPVCEIIMETVKNHPDILRKFILKCDNEGETILHTLARKGNKALCNIIIGFVREYDQVFKDLIETCNNNGQSCLHVAVLFENRDAFDNILEYVNTLRDIFERLLKMCDHKEQTVLHYAARNNCDEFIFLLWYKGKVHSSIFNELMLKCDIKGQTALHVAAYENHKHCCIMIFATIADYDDIFKRLIMKEDKEGNTALNIALTNGNQEAYSAISTTVTEKSNVFGDLMIQYNGESNVINIATYNNQNAVKDIFRKNSNKNSDDFKKWIMRCNNKQQTILHIAASNGNNELCDIILETVEKHGDIFRELIFMTDREGQTFLHVIASEGNKSLFDLIMTYVKIHGDLFKGLIMHCTELGQTVLHKAALKDNAEIFDTIIETVKLHRDIFEYLVVKCDAAGLNALQTAVCKGSKAVCETIIKSIKQNPDLLTRVVMNCNNESQTALHLAARLMNREIGKLIIETVENQPIVLRELLLKTDEEKQTALHMAAWKGQRYICDIIFESVQNHPDILKDLILKCDEKGQTALHLSTSHGNEEACEIIMDRYMVRPEIFKDLILKCDDKGRSALHTAAWNGNREACEIIMKTINGHPNILKELILKRDIDGQTVLHVKAWHQNVDNTEVGDIILEVVKHHPDVVKELLMISDNKGQTALHVAADHGHSDTCRVILKTVKEHLDIFKDFIMTSDNEGKTALHVAAWAEEVEVCYIILDNVKDHPDVFKDLVMKCDNERCTALHYALITGCKDVIDVALEKARQYPDVSEHLRIKFNRTL